MENKLRAETSITIHAPSSDIWEAITTPEKIKKYLMGTTVTTDWKVGSPIQYEGEFNGKKYKDKGEIKEIFPNHLFLSTY